LCFIAHLYKANGGTDMEVLGLFRPCFFSTLMTRECYQSQIECPVNAVEYRHDSSGSSFDGEMLMTLSEFLMTDQ